MTNIQNPSERPNRGSNVVIPVNSEMWKVVKGNPQLEALYTTLSEGRHSGYAPHMPGIEGGVSVFRAGMSIEDDKHERELLHGSLDRVELSDGGYSILMSVRGEKVAEAALGLGLELPEGHKEEGNAVVVGVEQVVLGNGGQCSVASVVVEDPRRRIVASSSRVLGGDIDSLVGKGDDGVKGTMPTVPIYAVGPARRLVESTLQWGWEQNRSSSESPSSAPRR